MAPKNHHLAIEQREDGSFTRRGRLFLYSRGTRYAGHFIFQPPLPSTRLRFPSNSAFAKIDIVSEGFII